MKGTARPKKEPRYRLTFIRQWRKHRGMSLETLADRVPMDKGNLSKVERGYLQYNQEMLERLADILCTDPASLIWRDPEEGEAMWSLWDRAESGTKLQIIKVAQALTGDKDGTNG